ncbi:hypothetical protein L1049_018664 [Liquidambar formosana]|uniref:Uncharacterized protein n=1 Tax=Liquidambar formosana TaxID=63359 RepID=A0AAP0RAD7_LIQFO
MDKETRLLSRLAINHLHLAQFEPFRATLLSLRAVNPDLAVAILQTIISQGARFPNILWSSSCPSPPLLTWLSTLQLLEFHNSSSAWSFDPETLRLRVEFTLLVQVLSSRVSESVRGNLDLEKIERDVPSEGFESPVESLKEGGELGVSENGGFDSVQVLDRVAELGLKRLKADVDVGGGGDDVSESSVKGVVLLEEEDLVCLRKAILEHADVFDALCWNIQKQVKDRESDDSGLAITVQGEEGERVDSSLEEEDLKVLSLVQRSVQRAHLDAMKECMEAGDVDGAVSHIRFLHLNYGLPEAEYRTVLQDLLQRVLSGRERFGETWHAMQEKLLMIYGEAVCSNCTPLVQMIQVIQDELLSEEIEMYKTLENNQIPPPLERFEKYFVELKPDSNLNDKTSSLKMAINSCMRDMYHYARVSGLHILECVMDTALSAVKREQLQEARNVLTLFPRLQPLVAVMGWDLLSGKTTARRKLMQLLWTSHRSQVVRLEESSLYGNQSNERSCVEHLCDSLCYQLDLASFVACVNSGQSWNSKFSLLLSANEETAFENEDAHHDTFVKNFVLERLSVQSPLRVLFDVVPGIKFKDAIELISMQSIASTVAAWKRIQDIELMHMRYALESIVLALGSMGRSMTDEKNRHH